MSSSLASDQIIFATAGYDHTIRFWNANTGQCYRVLQHNESQVNCMAIYPDKTLLATGGFNHVSIYDTMSQNQEAIYNLEGTVKNTTAIGFEEKGSWMYTAGEDKTLKLWDMKARYINCLQSFTHIQPISCVALHPNQVDFLIGDEVGNIIRWDIRANKSEQVPFFKESAKPKESNDGAVRTNESAIRSISINQEGSLMAAVNNDGNCFIWNLTGGFGDTSLRIGKDKVYTPHKRYGLKCLFSPDSTLLATSSADGTAKIWRTIDMSLQSECKDPRDPNPQYWCWDLAFTCDSRYLFTASSDKLAQLWSVQTGEWKKDYIGHNKLVVCIAFSDTKIIK